ncbi:MAG: hypothetical protein IKG40_02985 [Bacilli bacterium]|nr:hypothetical protein [Bacilli bacterium]
MANVKAGVVPGEGRKLANNMGVELKKVKAALDRIVSDIHAIEKGDGDGAYWNGNLARKTLNRCLENYDRNTVLYKRLVKVKEAIEILAKYTRGK